MTTHTQQLTGACEPYDHPLRFTVRSQSEPGSAYIVDLGAWGGNGSCNCPHFQFKLRRLLQAGALPSPKLRCKHIATARATFVDVQIKRIVEHEHELRRQRVERHHRQAHPAHAQA